MHSTPTQRPCHISSSTFKNLKGEFKALFDSQQIKDLPVTADLAAHFPEINNIVHDYINQLRKKAIDYENWLPRDETKTHHVKTRQLRIQAARTWLARVARVNLDHPRWLSRPLAGRP